MWWRAVRGRSWFDPPVALEHFCGAEVEPAVVCGACGQRAPWDTLTHRVQAPGWATTGPEAG